MNTLKLTGAALAVASMFTFAPAFAEEATTTTTTTTPAAPMVQCETVDATTKAKVVTEKASAEECTKSGGTVVTASN